MAATRIEYLLDGRHIEAYLEIGVRGGKTLQGVSANIRHGVDPLPRIDLDRLPRGVAIFSSTSDDYFVDCESSYDVVYCDGLHDYRQTYSDLINALNCLRPGGFVLVDDVVPSDIQSSTEPIGDSSQDLWRFGEKQGGSWMGDVFRMVYLLPQHSLAIDWRTITGEDGRPQLLAWRKSMGPIAPLSFEDVASVGHVNFEEAFWKGMPDVFQAASLDGAKQALQAGG